MGNLDKINELISKKERQTTKAHIRIEKLLDENSFVELGALNESASVVTGYGTINNRLVYVYSQYGPVDVKHATKVGNIYQKALNMGAPVIGIMDSKGLKLEDGIDAFEAYGILFSKQADASGIVPQISIVLGDCIGTASLTPMLSDFVVMTEKKARLFMSSPSTFEGLEGKETTYELLGGGKALSKKSAMVDMRFADEDEALAGAAELIGMLPSNNMEEPIFETFDDPNREDDMLNTVVPDDSRKEVDMIEIIKSVADNNAYFEIKKHYAPEIITALIRLNGYTTGIIANNGLLSLYAEEKAANFVNICDSFNIPIVSFTDVTGYADGVEAEQHGLLKNSAKLLFSFRNAAVPKINVIIRNANGNPYMLMNSKHIGADVVYAWPSARVSLMDKAGYVNVMGISSETFEKEVSPYNVASKGYLDDVIIPSATRKRLIVALEMLSSKRIAKAARKHSNIQF